MSVNIINKSCSFILSRINNEITGDMKKKNIAAISITLLIILITAGCGSGKKTEPIINEAERASSDEASIANTDDTASKESSATANTSYKRIADYNSYEELIEDIKNLLDVKKESDSDTFFDQAEQYEWFTFSINYIIESDDFGYLQVDIDGDGVDELLLGINGSEDDSYEAYIDAMFTIRNGKVDSVFESYSDRECFDLYKDGVYRFYQRDPNHYYSSEYYKYTAGKREFIEGIYNSIVYSPDDEYQIDYWYSDSASQTSDLTEEQYYEMLDELEHKYNRPKFQLHLFKDIQ